MMAGENLGEIFSSGQPQVSVNKKRSPVSNSSDRPQKRPRVLLDDSSDGDGRLYNHSGVSVRHENDFSSDHVLGVNQEFAQRFEHNKKREELQRRAFRSSNYSLTTQLMFS